MENWRSYSEYWTFVISSTKVNPIKVEKDEYGVKLKYPERQCTFCLKYPCFPEIKKCSSNFAAYGCLYYKGP